MYVCMHVFMYVCMDGWMGVCMCVRMYVCMYVCMCMCVCMYVCMCVCVYVCMYACMYVCVHMYVYVCMYECMHLHEHLCKQKACICVFVHVIDFVDEYVMLVYVPVLMCAGRYLNLLQQSINQLDEEIAVAYLRAACIVFAIQWRRSWSRTFVHHVYWHPLQLVLPL